MKDLSPDAVVGELFRPVNVLSNVGHSLKLNRSRAAAGRVCIAVLDAEHAQSMGILAYGAPFKTKKYDVSAL